MKFTLYIAAALALASVAMAAEKATTTEAAPKHTSAAGSSKTAVLPPIATGPAGGSPSASMPAPAPSAATATTGSAAAPSPSHNAAASSVVLNSAVSVAGLAIAFAAAL